MGAAVVLGGAALLLWNMAHDRATMARPTEAMPVVALTAPPPPPPPPPPKNPPPEPEKVQTETPQPQQNDQPKAPPQQLTINGPPQAGGDSFGLSAGNGQGSVIGGGAGPGGGDGGFSEAAYTRYLTGYIQQAVQQDDRVTRSVFQVDVQLWVDRGGKITGATVVKTSGDSKLDRQVVSVLQTMRLDQPPPAAFKNYFSHRITIRGRRA